jgi:hypothetical protein
MSMSIRWVRNNGKVREPRKSIGLELKRRETAPFSWAKTIINGISTTQYIGALRNLASTKG